MVVVLVIMAPPGVAPSTRPMRWQTRAAPEMASSSDYECRGFDEFTRDRGCQLRCTDDNCSKAVKALHATHGSHINYNCCPPYSGCVATLKRGRDALAVLAGDICERRCSARLDREAYYQLTLTSHKSLCKPRGAGGNSSSKGTGRGSSLSLVGDYLRARNVAIDFGRTRCSGRARVFQPGFLTASCRPLASSSRPPLGAAAGAFEGVSGSALALPSHLPHLRAIGHGMVLGAAGMHGMPAVCKDPQRVRSDAERRFTVFVTRDDMGNYAHHLGDMLALFQVFDHLHLSPSEAQVVLLDVRLMCWGGKECTPDCKGPFTQLWAAMTNGAPLVRAVQWAKEGPMCFREVVFSTHWSEVAKLAWAPPSQCVGSSILTAFRLRVLSSLGLTNLFPPSGKIRMVYSRRGTPGMNKRGLRRRILNEEEMLQAATAAYPDCELLPTDFGALTLTEQMAHVRKARVLFGMHGAGFVNLLWMPREAVVLELFPHKAMITPVHRNLAKFAGVVYMSWANPSAKFHHEPGAHTTLHWPSFRPTLSAAVRVARNYGREFSNGEAPKGGI